ELCITFVTPSVTRCRHRTVHHVRLRAGYESMTVQDLKAELKKPWPYRDRTQERADPAPG
ncbi:unnamed protein product, partial [Durusdinium trenchii]